MSMADGKNKKSKRSKSRGSLHSYFDKEFEKQLKGNRKGDKDGDNITQEHKTRSLLTRVNGQLTIDRRSVLEECKEESEDAWYYRQYDRCATTHRLERYVKVASVRYRCISVIVIPPCILLVFFFVVVAVLSLEMF